jgi:hypothetical protein
VRALGVMNTQIETPPSSVKVFAVSIDETKYYTLAKDDAALIKAIHNVYVYNADEHTYCCEFTPSFYLDPLYTYIEFVDGVSENDRERCEENYCYENSEGMYLHCRLLDTMTVKDCGEFETFEDAREHLQGNWPI